MELSDDLLNWAIMGGAAPPEVLAKSLEGTGLGAEVKFHGATKSPSQSPDFSNHNKLMFGIGKDLPPADPNDVSLMLGDGVELERWGEPGPGQFPSSRPDETASPAGNTVESDTGPSTGDQLQTDDHEIEGYIAVNDTGPGRVELDMSESYAVPLPNSVEYVESASKRTATVANHESDDFAAVTTALNHQANQSNSRADSPFKPDPSERATPAVIEDWAAAVHPGAERALAGAGAGTETSATPQQSPGELPPEVSLEIVDSQPSRERIISTHQTSAPERNTVDFEGVDQDLSRANPAPLSEHQASIRHKGKSNSLVSQRAELFELAGQESPRSNPSQPATWPDDAEQKQIGKPATATSMPMATEQGSDPDTVTPAGRPGSTILGNEGLRLGSRDLLYDMRQARKGSLSTPGPM